MCFIAYCEAQGVLNWTDYISFSSLRRAGVNPSGKPMQEIIYVHSKLLLVDDEHLVVGSANINDRSMDGNRDSEVCLHFDDKNSDTIKNFRLRLWSAYLGAEIPTISGLVQTEKHASIC